MRIGLGFAVVQACLLAAGIICTMPQENPPKNAVPPEPRVIADGRQNFEHACAVCHGLDGRGGEHAPNIARNAAVQGLSDGRLIEIIHDGIPQAGMPAFDFLSQRQIVNVVHYLRLLGSAGAALPLGDAPRGRELFFGKAGCARCHALAGEGGFIASDLGSYLMTHSAVELRAAIVDPNGAGSEKGRPLTIMLRDGQTVAGLPRNEDNFSLQLLDEGGRFHLVMKSEIARLRRATRSLMPADYATRLTPVEIDDLMRYIGEHPTPPPPADVAQHD